MCCLKASTLWVAIYKWSGFYFYVFLGINIIMGCNRKPAFAKGEFSQQQKCWLLSLRGLINYSKVPPSVSICAPEIVSEFLRQLLGDNADILSTGGTSGRALFQNHRSQT